jgi:hypothetical protein
MKKIIVSIFQFSLLFSSILFVGDSCKKEQVHLPMSAVITNLNSQQKVLPNDITTWISANLGNDYNAQIQLKSAQQSIINSKHVVRIPIGKDAALFFTKVDGKLQVFAYKWLVKDPKAKLFTGYLTTYSFQTNSAIQFVYSNSKVTKQNYVRVKTETKRIEPSNGPSPIWNEPAEYSNMDGSYYFDNIFAEFWCWLTGGTYVTQDDIDSGLSYGANGELGATGCDYESIAPDDDSGGDDSNYTYYGGIFQTGTPAQNGLPGGGSNGNSNSTYGGGVVWIFVPNQEGCAVTSDDGTQSLDPNSDCQPGYWVAYAIPVPGVDFMDPDATDADDGAVGTYDGYDTTPYSNYDQSQTWPTVANVIPKSNFIPYDGRNCLFIAQDPIAQLNYIISKLDAPGQTIQAYREDTGVNFANVGLAVSYLNYALTHGIPVIVGVDDAPGGQGNSDKSTNHFIVVVGMGSDSKGNFYRFYDSSTKNVDDGTSDNNKLYYNPSTGLITGSTPSLYGTQRPYMHPYIITQVRKSKHK